jgi:hypothetical protein
MLWTAQIETANGHPGHRAQTRRVVLWWSEPEWFEELGSSAKSIGVAFERAGFS